MYLAILFSQNIRSLEQLKQVLQQNWKKLSDPREPLKSQASRKQVSAGRITEVDSKGLEKRIDLKKEEVEYTLRLSVGDALTTSSKSCIPAPKKTPVPLPSSDALTRPARCSAS